MVGKFKIIKVNSLNNNERNLTHISHNHVNMFNPSLQINAHLQNGIKRMETNFWTEMCEGYFCC